MEWQAEWSLCRLLCGMFSLPFRLSQTTAYLKCLFLLLKTVVLFLTFGCSCYKIMLCYREVQLAVFRAVCKPGSQEHGKTVWWLLLRLRSFLRYTSWLSLCFLFAPLLRCTAAWNTQVTHHFFKDFTVGSILYLVLSVIHTQSNCKLHKEANTSLAI